MNVGGWRRGQTHSPRPPGVTMLTCPVWRSRVVAVKIGIEPAPLPPAQNANETLNDSQATANSTEAHQQLVTLVGFVFLVLQYLQLVRGNTALIVAVSLTLRAPAMTPAVRLIAPRLSARTGHGRCAR